MKEIPGFSGYYASEDGRIYSIRTGKIKELSQRMHKGYLHVFVRRGIGRNTTVKMPAHQLVLLTHKGEKKEPNLMCRHLDGNVLNNSIDNLKWGTAQENVLDMMRHKRAACLRKGQDSLASKLKESDVKKIIKLLQNGVKQSVVASMFNISQGHVSDIKLGKTWEHLTTKAPRGV